MDRFDPSTTIPEILSAAPHLREVFDRYGLQGCGGHQGPPESLAFFSRAHGVDLSLLLAELEEKRASVGSAAPKEVSFRPGPADTIYRRFFLGGILATLTAGAAWGAVLLARLAQGRSLTAVSLHDVNAHGHAQIFGWIGLFVMGFAYQALPRFRQTSLPRPGLAVASFWLMLVGLVLRTASEILAPQGSIPLVGIAGGALEIAAISIFVWSMVETLRRSVLPFEPYLLWIGAALFWFLAQGLYDVVYFAASVAAPSREALVALVADWQAPLRSLQVHGFAVMMVLGVSQRFLPGMLGFSWVPARLSKSLFVIMNLAVAGEACSYVLFRRTGNLAWAGLSEACVIVLAAGAILLIRALGLFRPLAETDRSVKFVRAAYVWLLLSLFMLAMFPVYSQWTGLAFSHAYYGASRHAITVGFLSLMILGVAAKVVPTLAGVDPRRLTSLWIPFLLVNTGCFLRVLFQSLTDFGDWAFRPAGVSGFLEVAGISIWAATLYPYLVRGVLPAEVGSGSLRSGPITSQDTVAAVLDAHPSTEEVFVRFGFRDVRNPVLRNSVARVVTLGRACAMHGVDLPRFLAELEETRLAH